jgi:hypothetical protein
MPRAVAIVACLAATLAGTGGALAQRAHTYEVVEFVLMRDVVTDPAWRTYLPLFNPNPGPDDWIALADVDLVPGYEVITTSWDFGLCGSFGCDASAIWTDGTRFAYLVDWEIDAVRWGPVLYLRDEVHLGLRTGHSDLDAPNFARRPDKKAEFVRAGELSPEVLAPIATFVAAESKVLLERLPQALVAILDFDGDGNPHNDDVFLSFYCEERCDVLFLHRNQARWVMWEEDMASDPPRDDRGLPILHARDEFFEGRRTYYEGPLRRRIPFDAARAP